MAEEKKPNVHNYFILSIIFIAVMCLVIYLCKWYNVYDEYQKETPIIRGSLQEIVSEDLEHYVLDNPVAVIYMCTSSDDACRSFEKGFKKLLSKRDYNTQIIYLNLSGIDQDSFVKDFNEKYMKKNKLTTNYPAFVLFQDGKAISILQGSSSKPLTVTKVKQFLEINDIGEE